MSQSITGLIEIIFEGEIYVDYWANANYIFDDLIWSECRKYFYLGVVLNDSRCGALGN